MEAIILMGIQGAGKSTFFQTYFCNTHVRINLDMLKTRHRENILLQACLEAKQSFVIDNTNPTLEDRSRYIVPAKEKGFQSVGYYFVPDLEGCKKRNSQRPTKQRIPLAGLLGTYKKFIEPSYLEGFDRLYRVKIASDRTFIVKKWKDEI
jgi:predicted kinase